MKKEAEQDVVKPKICRLEDSDEADVKKYFKDNNKKDKTEKEDIPEVKAATPEVEPAVPKKLAPNPFHGAPNPFHKGSPAQTTKSTPQKRRLTDSDKKVVNKASKKPRQESSSSGTKIYFKNNTFDFFFQKNFWFYPKSYVLRQL